MSITWIILFIAIAAETFATSMVKASDGFTRTLPSLGVIMGYAVSFYGLSQVVKTMNLGVAYAIWAGLGVVLISVLSRVFFNQKLDIPAIIGIGLIITGVIIIRLFSETAPH